MFGRLMARIDPAPFVTRRVLQNSGLVQLPIPAKREFWAVSNPRLLRTVLHAEAHKFDKGGPLYGAIRQALGNDGLFTVNDDALRMSLRQVMGASFGAEAQPTVALATSEALVPRLGHWGGACTDMFQEFKWVTTSALLSHLLGERQADTHAMMGLARPVFEHMATRVFLPQWLPGAAGYRHAIEALDAELGTLVGRRKQQPYGNDMLSALLMAQSERQLFTDQQIRDQVFTMLMAGFDSTAVALAWAGLYLAENPSMRAKLRKEVLEVTQGDLLKHSDLARLKMLGSFFQSVLHKHPSFPLYFRNVNQPVLLGGRLLRPGTQLLVAPHAAHRDPGYWPDQKVGISQFMGRLAEDRRYTHLPFGRGPRHCIGEQTATTSFMLVVGTMLARFERWERPARNGGFKATYAMTRPPADSRLFLD